MPTMIYSPGIKVYVETENNGTIDLSDDLTEGNMVRRSDGVSTFNFSIQNTRRKYDGIFTPNDRIVVLMKRLTWVQVFTGYLNSVPLVTAWPKVVSVSASCSLKRLQYWYWDPYAAATLELTRQALLATKNFDNSNTDGGLTNLILVVLDQVVGWPKSKVHIGRIPADWFEIAKKIADEIADEVKSADRVSEEYRSILGLDAVVGGRPANSTGSAAAASGTLRPGNYGGEALDQGQVDLASYIYEVGTGYKNVTEFDIQVALATAYAESTFHANETDGVSYGLFQQTPTWWGTKAECYDYVHATKAFYDKLLTFPDRAKRSLVDVSYLVQQCAIENKPRPGEFADLASDIIAKMTSNTSKAKVDPNQSQGVATGAAMVTFARQMIQDDPNITYQLGGTMNFKQYPPDTLDCQLLVRYVYYHVMGNNEGKLSGAYNVTGVIAKCRKITVKDALLTPGAVIVNTGHHIELCIGGNMTIGIGSTTRPAGFRDYNPNGYDRSELDTFDVGGLLPGLAYPAVGTSTTAYGGARTDNQGYAVDTGQGSYDTQTTLPSAPGGQDDYFNSLFGNTGFLAIPVDPGEMVRSASLSGVRALLNDQPLLGGFLKNVINASLRSFCSAPNGDLIAWFPDYYGLWGTSARMVVEPIELLDFEVDWSDDFFVTHQFTVLGFLNQIDTATGQSSVQYTDDVNSLSYTTFGLANIDIAAILEALFGVAATEEEASKFANFIYRKFGARPDYQTIDGMISNNDKRAEFFSALYLFMRQWAYQYNAQVPLTFMPELWPGMLLQVPSFDFQGYVTTVTHSFQFGPGGGFSTMVNLAAPARIPKKGGGKGTHTLIGLPLAGGFTPGLSPEDARKALHPNIEPAPPVNYGRQLPTPGAL